MRVDGSALRRGIGVYLAIAVPSGVVAALVDGSSSSGTSAVLLVAILLLFAVAPVVAGGVAGGAQAAPFVHGALAVAIPAGMFLVIRFLAGVARNNLTGVDVATFLLYLVIEIGLGMLGGYVAFRRHRRPAPDNPA